MNSKEGFSNNLISFGTPIVFLRLEGLAWFVFSFYLYHYFQGPWWLFAALFFVPDLSLAGYLLNSRIGAIFYNILHAEIGPVVLAGCSILLGAPLVLNLSLIWFCHINFDRMLGIGLKYLNDFKQTHLGVITFGKQK